MKSQIYTTKGKDMSDKPAEEFNFPNTGRDVLIKLRTTGDYVVAHYVRFSFRTSFWISNSKSKYTDQFYSIPNNDVESWQELPLTDEKITGEKLAEQTFDFPDTIRTVLIKLKNNQHATGFFDQDGQKWHINSGIYATAIVGCADVQSWQELHTDESGNVITALAELHKEKPKNTRMVLIKIKRTKVFQIDFVTGYYNENIDQWYVAADGEFETLTEVVEGYMELPKIPSAQPKVDVPQYKIQFEDQFKIKSVPMIVPPANILYDIWLDCQFYIPVSDKSIEIKFKDGEIFEDCYYDGGFKRRGLFYRSLRQENVDGWKYQSRSVYLSNHEIIAGKIYDNKKFPLDHDTRFLVFLKNDTMCIASFCGKYWHENILDTLINIEDIHYWRTI